MDVVAIGELLVDLACIKQDEDGYPTLEAHPGGAPANFLAPLAKFGKETAMIGKVGEDGFGSMLINTLKKNGISAEGMSTDGSVFTTLAFAVFDDKGDRDFFFARKPGADISLTDEDVNYSLIDRAKVVHFGTLSLTDEPARSTTYKAIDYARRNGKLISYDPNLRKPLWRDIRDAKHQMLWGLEQADVIKISDEEVEFLFGMDPEKGIDFIFDKYAPKIIYVTCGAEGAHYRNRNAGGFVPALKNIKVIDTTGAGDIFGGSAMYMLLETGKKPEDLNDREIRNIVEFATVSAGLSATQHGGINSVPDKEKILEVLR